MADSSTGSTSVGLPEGVTVCLFDLDGVITDTASVHQRAWKQMFDAFLETQDGQQPFSDEDYADQVDGKPRKDGVRDFLSSRGIELPEKGDPSVESLADEKNDLLLQAIKDDGVEVFPASVAYLHAVRDAGLRTAVVSSSANTQQVLEVTGLTDLFEVRVDGVVADELGLKGKPAPDTFLEGARRLGGGPESAVVFEDAVSGVQAGQAGGFAYVVGVDRVGHRGALESNGADRVVEELDELIRR